MSTSQKLFSFEGRLRRRDWWLYLILLALIGLLLAEIGMRMRGASMAPFMMGANARTFDRNAWMITRIEVQGAVSLLLVWPELAIGVKRLHDRGRSGWWLGLFIALSWAGEAVSLMRYSSRMPWTPFVHPDLPGFTIGVVTFGVGVWLLVELGFLDGTRGANRFGPSPKGVEAPA
jgi:uncharacterized membrane protein YhaH (DUF805 family)